MHISFLKCSASLVKYEEPWYNYIITKYRGTIMNYIYLIHHDCTPVICDFMIAKYRSTNMSSLIRFYCLNCAYFSFHISCSVNECDLNAKK